MVCEITVGVCVKNAQDTIGETIASIALQDFDHDLIEMIVVDGNSSDATLSIIRRMISSKNIAFRIFSDEGKGLGHARQIVVDRARGKYIVFVDGDVKLLPNFFLSQFEFMNNNTRLGVGLGRYLYKSGSLISSSWNMYQSMMDEFVGCAFVFRVDAVRMVHGFDENIKGAAEDVDLILRLNRRGWLTAVNQNAGFYHNYRETFVDFWLEHRWFGYGYYYLTHKHKNAFSAWGNTPQAKLLHGLRIASKTYRVTRCKMIFLIPVLLVIANMASWSGYLSAALHRYTYEARTEKQLHLHSEKSIPSKRESSSL